MIGSLPSTTIPQNHLFEKNLWIAHRVAARYAAKLSPSICREDLFQECVIALFRAATHFNPTLGHPFPAYATAVAARAARTYISRELRQGLRAAALPGDADEAAVNPQGVLTAAAATPDRVLWKQERWSRVLTCLSERQRRVLELRLFENLTNREIGEQLGFRASRASHLWHQAIDRIRDTVADIDD